MKKTVKKLISFLLAFCLIFTAAPLAGFAGLFSLRSFAADIIASGFCGDNVTWTLDSNGLLTIDGTGPMEQYEMEDSPFSEIKTIKTAVITSGVTSIGACAFKNCSSMTSITIPDTVKSIGNGAFLTCSSLTSITIPDGVTYIGYSAFSGCSSLTSITIPDGETTILDELFYNCSSLTTITIPDSVKSICGYAFYGCSQLTDVDFTGSEYDWNAININEGNENLSIARIHYVCGTSFEMEDNTISLYYKNLENGLLTVTVCSSVQGLTTFGFYIYYDTDVLQFERVLKTADSNALGWDFSFGTNDQTSGKLSCGGFFADEQASNRFELADLVFSVKDTEAETAEFGLSLWDYSSHGTGSVNMPGSVTIRLQPLHVHEWELTGRQDPTCMMHGRMIYTCKTCEETKTERTGKLSHTDENGDGFCDACGNQLLENGITIHKRSAEEDLLTVTLCSTAEGMTTLDIIIRYDPDILHFEEWYSTEDVDELQYGSVRNDYRSYCSDRGNGELEYSGYFLEDQPEGFFDLTDLVFSVLDRNAETAEFSITIQKVQSHNTTPVTVPENITIRLDPPHVHSWDEGQITLEPTCRSTGVITYTCADCGDTKTEDIPATGIHTDENWNGVCDVCGESIEVIANGQCGDQAYWSLNDAGLLTVSGTGTMYDYENEGPHDMGCGTIAPWGGSDEMAGRVKRVVVENGVTSVGWGAFSGCANLTSVVLADSLTEIGPEAFAGCTSLAAVTIPDGVKSVGFSAFFCCSELSSVVLPADLTSIEEYTFANCVNLVSVKIPEGVTRIEEAAFSDCQRLSSVKIPNGVKSIEMFAFYNCIGLVSVEIPDSVRSIGYEAFADCDSLMELSVPDDVCFIHGTAPSYTGWEQNAPDGVLYLGSVAYGYKPFDYAVNGLAEKNIGIQDGTKTVNGFIRFAETVELPLSVTAIDLQMMSAFELNEYDAWFLKELYYQGTENDFAKIRVYCDYTENNENIYYNEDLNVHRDENGKLYMSIEDFLAQDDFSQITVHCVCEHVWNDGVETKPATVSEEGEKTYTCTVCGATKTESIPKLTEQPKIDTENVKETETGVYVKTGETAADLLALAGEGATLTKEDGSAVKTTEKVGSGMVLTKADGTQETVIVKGDNDGDGTVTAADARYALRVAVSLEDPNAWQKDASLVEGNDTVTAADARVILRAAVGLEDLKIF